MAKSQDQFNEKAGKKITVSDEAVDKAAKKIEQVGYVTEKDVPEMIDRDYTRALSKRFPLNCTKTKTMTTSTRNLLIMKMAALPTSSGIWIKLKPVKKQ